MTTLTLTNYRAEVMKLAWKFTTERHENQWVYDWTPGPGYGSRRKPNVGELRTIFAAMLREAWANINMRLAYIRKCLAARATARPLDVIRAERDMLQNKSRWTQADYARDDALRQEEAVWYA